MSSGRERSFMLIAIGLLVVAGLAFWLVRNIERKPQEITLPPKGEAAYNPFYALKRALQIDGVTAQSRRRLSIATQPLGVRDTVVSMGDLRAQAQNDAEKLLAWIEAGGHLIAAVPAYSGNASDASAGVLMDALGAYSIPVEYQKQEDAGCARLKSLSGKVLELCSATRIALDDDVPVAAAWEDDHGYLYTRLPYGKGSVDLLTDLSALNNDGLENPANAAFARQLLAPNYRIGTVHLIYDAELPPWWRLLLEQFWPALLPLALAVAAWLWLRTQRFGQWLPSPEPVRRSLLEHVQASGELLYRHGRGHLLYSALRQRFQARLQQRDPLIATLEGAAQQQALAARTDLTELDVATALRAPVPFNAADLRLRIATLNRLRNRL